MTDPTASPDPWSRPTADQPTYGEPTPTQPVYPPTQPVYPPTHPAYPQAGYPPQPAYGQPMYYDPATMGQFPPPPPKKMSGGLKALLWAIPIVVVLAAVGIGFALASSPAAVNDVRSNTAQNGSDPAPTNADTFTMPSSALGMPQTSLPTLSSIIDPLKQALGDQGTISAAAYSGGSDPRDILIMIGMGTDLHGESGTFQTMVLGGIGSSLGGSNQQSYPAGPMGGSLTCEDGKEQAMKIGICSVADNGGALILIYFNHTGADTAAAVAQLRPKVEKQG